ncbi:MAG: glycyl-radical enzyme activating protein [Clostridia bacterium]|nr:glycyl-radical enzyme activating protein [Clostridia bacterium]
MNKIKATIFEIQRNSYVDGPGIRTTIFFKGCNLKCKWCHNPESQVFSRQMMHYKTKCTGCGQCRQICQNTSGSCVFCGQCIIQCPNEARQICGKEYTVQEVFEQIIKDKIFYEASGGGVTFSGGECMLQADFLEEILKMCKEAGIHTAVDTAGNVPWESFEKILPYTDMFLYDIKAVSENLHIEGTSVSNKTILSNLKQLSDNGKAEIVIRIPIIPDFNTHTGEIRKIADFLQGIRYKNIELLPYHKMGQYKYEALNMHFNNYPDLDKGIIESYKKIF